MHRRILGNNSTNTHSIHAIYGRDSNQNFISLINYQAPYGLQVQEMSRMHGGGIAAGYNNTSTFTVGQSNVSRQTSFLGKAINGLVNLVPAAYALDSSVPPQNIDVQNAGTVSLLWRYATNKLTPEQAAAVRQGIGQGLVEGSIRGEECTFGVIRKAKDWVVNDYFSGSLRTYERICQERGIKLNVTSMAYAGPGIASTALSVIPDTPAQFATEVGITVGAAPAAEICMWGYYSYKGRGIVKTMDPTLIKFSQSSVNDWSEIIVSMKQSGWKWYKPPIDVVRMKDGTLITLDNTRVIAAHEAGVKVRAIERQFDKKLPNNKAGERFKNKRSGVPDTWEEAVTNRIDNQNLVYRDTYPNGSYVIGLGKP